MTRHGRAGKLNRKIKISINDGNHVSARIGGGVTLIQGDGGLEGEEEEKGTGVRKQHVLKLWLGWGYSAEQIV